MPESAPNVTEIRYGAYQLKIPAEDFDTVKAQFDAALAYLKKKLSPKLQEESIAA